MSSLLSSRYRICGDVSSQQQARSREDTWKRAAHAMVPSVSSWEEAGRKRMVGRVDLALEVTLGPLWAPFLKVLLWDSFLSSMTK